MEQDIAEMLTAEEGKPPIPVPARLRSPHPVIVASKVALQAALQTKSTTNTASHAQAGTIENRAFVTVLR